MRLIDADALLAKQANIAKAFAKSDAQKSLMGRVIFNTECAPTIDAIPVEWLRKVMMNDVNDSNSSNAAFQILELWQKEQEEI